MNENRDILIIISTGKEDGGRKASLGFALATSSVFSGIKTSLFLTGSGSTWGVVKHAKTSHIEGFESIDQYINDFISNDGKLLMCSPCLKFYCGIEEHKLDDIKNNKEVYSSMEYVGFATIADIASRCSVINF